LPPTVGAPAEPTMPPAPVPPSGPAIPRPPGSVDAPPALDTPPALATSPLPVAPPLPCVATRRGSEQPAAATAPRRQKVPNRPSRHLENSDDSVDSTAGIGHLTRHASISYSPEPRTLGEDLDSVLPGTSTRLVCRHGF